MQLKAQCKIPLTADFPFTGSLINKEEQKNEKNKERLTAQMAVGVTNYLSMHMLAKSSTLSSLRP